MYYPFSKLANTCTIQRWLVLVVKVNGPALMYTIRLHIPRVVGSVDMAIIETTWDVSPSTRFLAQLEDIQSALREPFSLEIYSKDNCVFMCIAGERPTVERIAAYIYGYAGELEIHEIPDYTENITENTLVAGADLSLELPDIYPLQDIRNFSWDSLVPVLTAMGRIPETDSALVQVLVRPLPSSTALQMRLFLRRAAEKVFRLFRPARWFRTGDRAKTEERIKEKALMPLFSINYRISSRTELPENFTNIQLRQARNRLRNSLAMVSNAAKALNTTYENRFRIGKVTFGSAISRKIRERRFHAPFRASAYEVVSMWHPPALTVLPNTARVLSKKVSAPRGLPIDPSDSQISFFGQTNYRGFRERFGIRRFDRRRHLYLLGKSGSGKSCLLELLIKSDIEQGYGCAVLDPHGDLVDDVMRFIPQHRVKDVVIFDPSDIQYPPIFNPMIPVKSEHKMRVALGFLDTFKRVLGSSWSEKMDHVLRYAMIALLNVSGTSIVSLRRLLSDEDFRNSVIRRTDDEAVRRFWELEFQANRADFEAGPISQLLNKLDELLATDMVRNILGQPGNAFDFRNFMDSRKIVLCKVSKGVLGAETASLLGSLIIWKIYEAAMSRADQAVDARQDFYFYIDEFHNFATSSFGEILSESRKYRLCLTFANQFLGQLPPGVSDTVFGNIGNLISFRVGGQDAGGVASELKPMITSEDLLNLGLREFYSKLSIDGQVQEPFSGRTLDVTKPSLQDSAVRECIAHSRKHYALPIDKAEEQLALSEIMSPRCMGAG
jgi:hypothetical protein